MGSSSRVQARMDIYKLKPLPSEDELLSFLSESSRVLKALELERAREERNIESLDGETKHDLSLNLSAGLESGAENYGDSFELNKPETGISLSYSRSLGQGEAKADAERSRLQKLEINKNYQNQFRVLSQSAVSLLAQLEGLQLALKASRSQINSASKRTKAERDLYEQGRGSLNFVLQAQDSEQSARLTYAETATIFQTLTLQLQELRDKLYSNDI